MSDKGLQIARTPNGVGCPVEFTGYRVLEGLVLTLRIHAEESPCEFEMRPRTGPPSKSISCFYWEALVYSNLLFLLKKLPARHIALSLVMAVVTVYFVSCGGNPVTPPSFSMGTVSATISDPPKCLPPNGHFMPPFLTRSPLQAQPRATAHCNG